jgi:hypothetical protein
VNEQELERLAARLVSGPREPGLYVRTLEAAAVTRRGLELLRELAEKIEGTPAPPRPAPSPHRSRPGRPRPGASMAGDGGGWGDYGPGSPCRSCGAEPSWAGRVHSLISGLP